MNKDLHRVLIAAFCFIMAGCAAHNFQPSANGTTYSANARSSSVSVPDSGLRALLNAVNPTTGQVAHFPVGTKIYSIGGFVVRDGEREYAFAPRAHYSIGSSGALTVQYEGHVRQFSRTAYVSSSSQTTQYIVVYPGEATPKGVQGQRPVYVVK